MIGSVDHGEHGNAGLELALDEDLAGKVGEVRMLTDSRHNAYAAEVETLAVAGKDVTITIDSRIQNVAERALTEAAIRAARNQEAWWRWTRRPTRFWRWPITRPTIRTRIRRKASLSHRGTIWRTSPYEPGSVFKVVTLSAALETTPLRPESPVNCGPFRLGSHLFKESHARYYGTLSLADVLAKSSNLGAIQIGLRVGQERMIEYVKRLGFGQPTGLPLPSESGGKVRKNWTTTSLASVSMGHEVMVTALQLAELGTIIANGGTLTTPRLVIRKQRTGAAAEVEPSPKRVRVLKPETAITMRQLMEGVVLYGTARGKANLKGYTSGGKTGTAQIFDFKTKQYSHFYNGSFLGFAPVNNPSVVMVVTLNGTTGGGGYGGQVAAPVFREVAAAALRLMDVKKDLPEDLPPVREEKIDADDLSIAGLDPAAGDELVSSEPQLLVQGPPALDQHVFTKAARVATGPKVPNFSGKTMRDVLQEASTAGLAVEVMGSGVARLQMPPPGAVLPPGEKVRVQFVR